MPRASSAEDEAGRTVLCHILRAAWGCACSRSFAALSGRRGDARCGGSVPLPIRGSPVCRERIELGCLLYRRLGTSESAAHGGVSRALAPVGLSSHLPVRSWKKSSDCFAAIPQ